MKKKLFFLTLVLSFASLNCIYEPFFFVDFDQSMNRLKKALENYHPYVNIFKALYEKNKFECIMPEKTPRIPKIIHQIWLGSRVPRILKPLMESWLKHHPGWQYKLWTDKDISHFNLENQELFDAAKNYGQRSDILRYEILYRYGGLYVDIDFQCLERFDLLHHCYDFYAGLFDTMTGSINNALIGCVPGHPIMKAMISSLKNVSEKSDFTDIIALTGPNFFTDIFLKTFEQAPGRSIIFPCTFFYPSPNTAQFDGLKKQSEFIRPESFAIHFWACTWQDPAAYVKE